MSKKNKRARNKRNRRAKAGVVRDRSGLGLGSPIETRCQARGLVTVDRRKEAARKACRGRVSLG